MDTLAVARLIADAPHATRGSFSSTQWAAAERVLASVQHKDEERTGRNTELREVGRESPETEPSSSTFLGKRDTPESERPSPGTTTLDTAELWRFISLADQIFGSLSIAHTKWHPESPMGQYETARAKAADILNRIDSQKESPF